MKTFILEFFLAIIELLYVYRKKRNKSKNNKSIGNRSLLDFFSRKSTTANGDENKENSSSENQPRVIPKRTDTTATGADTRSKPKMKSAQERLKCPVLLGGKLLFQEEPKQNESENKMDIDNASESLPNQPHAKQQLKKIIKNEMFADLAVIVELYNTFSFIYENKRGFKHLLKKDQIEFTKIKLNDLVDVLNADLMTKSSRTYFTKLIVNLLKILLKYETNLEVI